MAKDEITIYEAAALLNKSHSQVTRYISAGRLPARKLLNIYLIPRRAVERFVPPKPGNPGRRKSK